MVVRELITKLGFSMNQSQLNNAEKGINQVKGRAEQAATAFRNMAAALASFATIKSIINIADEMQSIRARIGMLPQTIGEAGAAFDEVAKRASASGVSIDAYASLYTRIGNAGKDYINTQEDLLGVTDTISKSLIVSGATTQEASSAMIQFSQALAAGVLQGNEFAAMSKASPLYLAKLAETMKIPSDQLKKMASEGKLTAKEVIEATRKISDYFEEKFKEMPFTVGRAITVVSNRFSQMIDKMNRDSKLSITISEKIIAVFDKIEAGIDKLVEKFEGWDNIIRLIGISIGVAFGAKALAVLATFRVASLLALWPFVKMALVLGIAVLALEDLYVWIQGGDSVIGVFVGKWEDVKYAILGVATTVGIMVGAFGIFKASMVGYTLALKAYRAAIIAVAAVKRGLIIVALALNLAMSLNPIGLMVIAIGALIAAGALLIVYWKEVSDFFSGLFSMLIDGFENVGKWVARLFGKGGELENIGDINVNANNGITPAISQAQLAPSAMGAGRPNIQSNTNVTVTVPPGTTAEQAKFLQTAVQQSLNKVPLDKFARDCSTYGC